MQSIGPKSFIIESCFLNIPVSMKGPDEFH